MRRRIAWAPLALLLGLAAACAAQQPATAPAAPPDPLAQAKALVERAERAAEQGYSPSPFADPAVEELKRIASGDNPPPAAFFYLGRAYALAGHPEIASRCLNHYLGLEAAGQEALRSQARDFVLRTEFILGCEALSMGHGRTAERHLAVAARLAPDNPLVGRKLEAALSGLYDPSRKESLSFPPDEPESPTPLVVARTEVFPRYAPRAMSRMAAGDLPGAGADIDKLMAARGANAILAALRAAIYFQSGEGPGALERFGPAYADPIVPTDLPVLTTRIGVVDGRIYRVSRICEGALLSMTPYVDVPIERQALATYLARNNVVAVSRIGGLFAAEKPEQDFLCRLLTRTGTATTETRPNQQDVPASVLELLDPELVACSRVIAFARSTEPVGELRFVLRRGESQCEIAFEEPPLASAGWIPPTGPSGAGAASGGTTVTPPDAAITVASLADACLPVFSRTGGEPATVRAVWMTGRFLEALCRLSANAPDIADLRALRKVSETHLVFMVMAPDIPQDATLAGASVLVGSGGDRRFGAYLDSLAEMPGLSARAKAYGICFPIASKTGKKLPLDGPGDLTVLVGGQEALRFRFTWQLPLAEPPLLRSALGEGSVP